MRTDSQKMQKIYNSNTDSKIAILITMLIKEFNLLYLFDDSYLVPQMFMPSKIRRIYILRLMLDVILELDFSKSKMSLALKTAQLGIANIKKFLADNPEEAFYDQNDEPERIPVTEEILEKFKQKYSLEETVQNPYFQNREMN